MDDSKIEIVSLGEEKFETDDLISYGKSDITKGYQENTIPPRKVLSKEAINLSCKKKNNLMVDVNKQNDKDKEVTCSQSVVSLSSASTYSTCSEKRDKYFFLRYCNVQDRYEKINISDYLSTSNNSVVSTNDIKLVSSNTNSFSTDTIPVETISKTKSLDSVLSLCKSDVSYTSLSFDSLLKTVLEANKNKFINFNTGSNKQKRLYSNSLREVKTESFLYCDESRFKPQLSIDHTDESASSLSLPSMPTFKSRNPPRNKFGINDFEINKRHLKQKVNNKTRAQKEEFFCQGDTTNWENCLQDEFLNIISTESSNAEHTDGTSRLISQNDDDRNTSKIKIKETNDVKVNKNDCTTQNLNSPKPQIKHLEQFLNLVRESQKTFDLNVPVDGGCWNENSSDLTRSVESDVDLNESFYSFASCENTTSTEYVDASSPLDHGLSLMSLNCFDIKKKNFINDIHLREPLDDLKNYNQQQNNYTKENGKDNYACFKKSKFRNPKLFLDEINAKNIIAANSNDNQSNFTILPLPGNYNENNDSIVNEDLSKFKNDGKADMKLKLCPLLSYLYRDKYFDKNKKRMYQNYIHKKYNRDIICANFSVYNDKNNEKYNKEDNHDNDLQNICDTNDQSDPAAMLICEDQLNSLENYSFMNKISSDKFSFQNSNEFCSYEEKMNADKSESTEHLISSRMTFIPFSVPEHKNKKGCSYRNNKSFEFRCNYRINNKKSQQHDKLPSTSKFCNKDNSYLVYANRKNPEQNMQRICYLQNEKLKRDSIVAGETAVPCGIPVKIYDNKNNCIKLKKFNNGLTSCSNKVVKGILKKKNTDTENNQSQFSVSNELNSVDESQVYKKKKSVKFTVPIDSDDSANSFEDYLQHSKKMEFKCWELEREKLHELRTNGNEIKKTVIEPTNCIANMKITSSSKKSVMYETSFYNVLIRISKRTILEHLHYISNKLNKSDSSVYLDCSPINSYSSFKHLKPNKIYKNELHFIESKDMVEVIKRTAYKEKFEVVDVIQYCKPLCILSNIGTGIIRKNPKAMKNKRLKVYGNVRNSVNITHKTPFDLTTTPTKIQLNDDCKLSKTNIRDSSYNEVGSSKIKDINLNTLNQMTDVILNNKRQTYSENHPVNEWSHFLFDISTTSDAVLSLTAYESDMALNDFYNINVNSLFQEHSNKAEQCLMNNESRINSKFNVNSQTVNIVLCNLLKQKPLERKKINLRGTILEYNDCTLRETHIADSGLEEFPVHDKTESCEELLACSDNYSEEYEKYLKKSEQIKIKQIKINLKRENDNDVQKTEKEIRKQNSKIAQKLNKNFTNPNPFSFDKKKGLHQKEKISICVDESHCDATLQDIGAYKPKKYDADLQSSMMSNDLQEKFKNQPHVFTNICDNTDNKKCRNKHKFTTESGDSNHEINIEQSDTDNGSFIIQSEDSNLDLQNFNELAANINNEGYLKRIQPESTAKYGNNLDTKRKINSESKVVQPKRSRSTQLTITDKPRVKDRKSNDHYSKNKLKEFIDANDSCSQKVGKNINNDIQSENSQTSDSLTEDIKITTHKTQIKNKLPQKCLVKKELLKKMNKNQRNPHIKPTYPYSKYNKTDCYGAPLKDSSNLDIYNEFGKPILNIYGCRIYDSYGIPKDGAYGKPIHSILRNKLRTALMNVKIDNRMPYKQNTEFEEDLFNVLNSYQGLKTDLYGRVYDFYGRPLFDRYGYLQYDVNGNPLTDAYNRPLRDLDGKSLMTYNSSQFANLIKTSKTSAGKNTVTTDNQNEYFNKDTNFKPNDSTKKVKSILLSNHDKLPENLTKSSVKKQVSFDECTVIYLENKLHREPRKSNSLPHYLQFVNPNKYENL